MKLLKYILLSAGIIAAAFFCVLFLPWLLSVLFVKFFGQRWEAAGAILGLFIEISVFMGCFFEANDN